VNLALRDVRRHLARFVGTAAGLGLLLSVVVAMQGIYAGMVDDATILTRAMQADLWLVQRDTRGPFAEGSRLDPSVEARAAAVPGVRTARPYTYQLIQREHRGAVMRIALVGLGWPDDPGRSLPLVRGRRLQQPHGEMIVDASLGLGIGESLALAGEQYRVVGLTKNALTSGGESVAFVSVADAELIAFDQPAEASGARTSARGGTLAPHGPRPRAARSRGPRDRFALACACACFAPRGCGARPSGPASDRRSAGGHAELGRRQRLLAGRGGGAAPRWRRPAGTDADRALHRDPHTHGCRDHHDGHVQPHAREDARSRRAQAHGCAANLASLA
jgi:hypothetical protein